MLIGKWFTAPVMFLFFLIPLSCTHTVVQKENSSLKGSSLYSLLFSTIEELGALQLKECNCMEAFYRDLSKAPDDSVRYLFDRKVALHAGKLTERSSEVRILVMGSGQLLNELTAVAGILASGKSLRVYLSDWAYVLFYEKDFKARALHYGEHPEDIPPGWKDFYFWEWYKDKKKPYLPFFEKHHQAISQFRDVLKKLDQHYGTTSTVEVILPPKDREPVILPALDLIVTVDAFLDIPNMMGNLFYSMRLSQSPVRYVALNKTKSMGGFYDSDTDSHQSVKVEVYDLNSSEGFGSFRLVESFTVNPTLSQKQSFKSIARSEEEGRVQGIFDHGNGKESSVEP